MNWGWAATPATMPAWIASSIEVPARPADLEQVAALGLELGHLNDLLPAHLLEVHDHAIGAGLGHETIEGNDDDARVASLLDGAVERVGRGSVDDDRVVALQDQILDLRCLRRHRLVGRREHVGGFDHLVGDRLLGDGVVAAEHRLPPRIAGVVVGERDLLAAGIGQRRTRRQNAAQGAQGKSPFSFHRSSSFGCLHGLSAAGAGVGSHLGPRGLRTVSIPALAPAIGKVRSTR